jgi:hypothetical protein
MGRVWQTIRGYIWWTFPRGSVQYDVMVTLILLFIFLAPRWVNFNDKPAERALHQSAVLVIPNGEGFIYQIQAAAVSGTDDASIRADLLRVVEPIAGEARVTRYEIVRDANGHPTYYRAWVEKPYH